MSDLIFLCIKACISWHMIFGTCCGQDDKIEPRGGGHGLRIKLSEVGKPTVVGSDVKENF